MIQISQDILSNWFTADTVKPDRQLSRTIRDNPSWKHKTVPSQQALHRTLFGCDSIYSHYKGERPAGQVNYAAHITHKSLDVIKDKINKTPKFIVEVGSFIGYSAKVLADYVKAENGQVLCIDTWCGDINMWLMKEFSEYMHKQDGNPKLYDRFMHNIIDWGISSYVTPLRVSSIVGARMLKVLNFDIDLVYLDSAHEAGETFFELSLYFDLLNKNGVIFGDDFTFFPAVGNDVKEFCRVHGLEYFMLPDNDTWAIQKTK